MLDNTDEPIKMKRFVKVDQNNDNLQPWNTMQIAFSYHSKDQDLIYDQINWDIID